MTGTDVGVAVYYRYALEQATKISYVGHLAGAAAGLLMGILVLRNLKHEDWETYLWWSCLAFLGALLLTGAIWNLVLIFGW